MSEYIYLKVGDVMAVGDEVYSSLIEGWREIESGEYSIGRPIVNNNSRVRRKVSNAKWRLA